MKKLNGLKPDSLNIYVKYLLLLVEEQFNLLDKTKSNDPVPCNTYLTQVLDSIRALFDLKALIIDRNDFPKDAK
jgi:hypothetical protein